MVNLLLRVFVVILGLSTLAACDNGRMDPIKTGGDAPGDIKN